MKSYLEIELENQILQGKILLQKSPRSQKSMKAALIELELWDNGSMRLISKYFSDNKIAFDYKSLSISYECDSLKKKRELYANEINEKIIFLAKLVSIDIKSITPPVKKIVKRIIKLTLGGLTVLALFFGTLRDGFNLGFPELFNGRFSFVGDYNSGIKRLKKSTKDFKIALLPFTPDRNCQYEKSNYELILLERLKNKATEENLSIETVLLETEMCPITIDEVFKIGNETRADLVIWGEYDEDCSEPTKIRLRYAFLKGNDWIKPVTKKTQKKELKDIELLREGFLQREMDDLIYYCLALSALKKGDWRNLVMYTGNKGLLENYESDPLKTAIYDIVLQIKMTKSLLNHEHVSVYELLTTKEKIAFSYFYLERYDLALNYFIELNNEFDGFYSLTLASIYYNLKEYEEAWKMVQKSSYFEIGAVAKILHKKGESDRAIDEIDKYIASDNQFKDELRGLILKYYILIDSDRQEEAIMLQLRLMRREDFNLEQFEKFSWKMTQTNYRLR